MSYYVYACVNGLVKAILVYLANQGARAKFIYRSQVILKEQQPNAQSTLAIVPRHKLDLSRGQESTNGPPGDPHWEIHITNTD